MNCFHTQRIATAVLIASLSVPVTGAETPQPRPKLPAAVETVYGLAMAAPPEFGSNALLRVEANVPDKELRRNLIDLAFRLAGSAQTPVRLQLLPGVSPDTRSGSRSGAMNLRLDRLSLESRAVTAMLQVDPQRGRELFNQMQRPDAKVTECSETMLPDPSAYYDALAAVIRSGFTAKERTREDHVGFGVAQLSRIASVRELEPAAKLIAALDWNRAQFEIAAGSFTSKLEAVPLDSRAFLASAEALDGAIAAIVSQLRQNGSVTEPLVTAYRNFLVAQFRGARCEDAGQPAGRIAQPGQRIELFGEDLRGDLPPLLTEEMTPKFLEGKMEVHEYWQTDTAQRIFQQCLLLRQGPGGVNYTDAARRTNEWARQFTDFLSTLGGWGPNAEDSDADYFHQKAIVYEALLELAPPGELSDRALESFMSFLKSSGLAEQRPVEWYWHARSTLDRVMASSPHTAAKLAAAYRSSGNIILTLDAALDAAAPQNRWFNTAGASPAPQR